MARASVPKGFIFDMDDLLIRSEEFWRQALGCLLRETGLEPDRITELRYRGLSANDTVALVHRHFVPETGLLEMQGRFSDHLLEALEDLGVEALSGAVAAVQWAGRHGRVAVASGSPLPVIRHVLAELGVADAVEVVLSSHDVARGKPAPDVFLRAAELLQIAPEDCVVFEDSLVGVQAASAAGMRCIAVPVDPHDEIHALAFRVLPSLEEVSRSGIPGGWEGQGLQVASAK